MPLTGDVRHDLLAMAGGLATKLRNPQWSRIMATLIDAAEADPEVAELTSIFTHQRREAVVAVLERGIADGELDPDIDARLASQLVGGALFYQRFMLRRPADDPELERIIDLALDGLRKR
jgi:AcrR family transcriptional regulator